MNRLAHTLAALIPFLSVPGYIQAETLNQTIAGTQQVSINLSASVEFKQGAEDRLQIEAEAHVLKAITVKHSGANLKIDSKPYRTQKPVKVSLVLKNLNKYVHEGSGEVKLHPRTENTLLLDAKGSGNLVAEQINVKQLTVDLNGGMDLGISGKGEKAKFELSGSGKIAAAKFTADAVQALLSGAGDIEVHATHTLNAKHTGSGDIRYRGKPNVSKTMDGSGNIEPF
ncbi:MAG: hypothetical protein RLZZ502_628 [Pseudomonadota bacterium]|jgi:hypothetical protein